MFPKWTLGLIESKHSYRLSNEICSTQAELYAVLCGLEEVKKGEGDVQFYVGSGGALETLSSSGSVFRDIGQCKNAVLDMSRLG